MRRARFGGASRDQGRDPRGRGGRGRACQVSRTPSPRRPVSQAQFTPSYALGAPSLNPILPQGVSTFGSGRNLPLSSQSSLTPLPASFADPYPLL